MMRNLALTAALAVAPAFAQGKPPAHVTATYEVTTQVERQLPPELAYLRSQLPNTTTSMRRLRYDGAQAVTDDAPIPVAEEKPEAPVRVRRNSEGTLHIRDGKALKQVDFMDRRFLVEEDAPRIDWQVTKEAAEFLGHVAYKATATVDDKAVEAWFAPSISAPVGPEAYGGLPGLILVLSENGGRRTYVAQEVSVDPLGESLVAPAEGRRMTGEEYDALVREKIEQLRNSRRPGSIVIPGG